MSRLSLAFLKERRTVLFFLAALAFFSGLVSGRELMFTIAYMLALLLILSFLWAWISINSVHLSRATRTRRAQVGQTFEERFQLRNTSRVPKLWLEMRDNSTLPKHLTSQVIHNLGPNQVASWRALTACRERGYYRLGPIELHTSDPFGLFPMSRKMPGTMNVLIYPRTFDIHYFALPQGLLSGGEALRYRTHTITSNAAGVRDYSAGDSYNRIHWPSTARRNRLIVKEFELDPLADIWIMPDMSVFGQVLPRPEVRAQLESTEIAGWLHKENSFELPESTEEYTVSIAASLAQYFLRLDRSVGLLAYSQTKELLQPDRGERQMNRILERLAGIRAIGDVSVADMLQAEIHLFPRGTTLIVISAMTQPTWATVARQLARRGLRVVTIIVNPASFHSERSADALVTALQGYNLLTYTVNYGDNITAVLSKTRQQTGYHR